MNQRVVVAACGAAGLGLAALVAWLARADGPPADPRIAVSFEGARARTETSAAEHALAPAGSRTAVSAAEKSDATVPREEERTPGRLAPRDERTLGVQVVDPAGHPVAGARLEVHRGTWARASQVAETDDLGYRELRGVSPGDRLDVAAKGFLGERLTLPADAWPEPLTVPLRRGALLLSGVVLDEHRAPVPGAELVLAAGGRRHLAESEGDGRFAFEAAPDTGLPDEVLLSVRSAEHCFLAEGLPLAWREHLVDGELRIVLLTWARLTVRLSDRDGRGLSGGELVLALPPDHEERFLVPGGGPRVSLAGGAPAVEVRDRVLERVPPRIPLSLVVRHPDCEPIELFLGELEPGEEREVEAVLERVRASGPIVFRILDARGAPSAGAGASLSVGGAGSSSWSRLEVDAGGRVRVDPPGADWVLTVWAEGHLPLERAHAADFRSAEEIELVLEPSPHRLEVRVTDARGGPLADLSVAVVPLETGGSAGEWRLRTDADGRAVFRGLEPDTLVRVELGHGRPGHYFPGGDGGAVPSPAFRRLWFDGDEEVGFRLVPPASVEGRILATGLEGATAHLSCYGEAPHPDLPRFAVAAPLDADGSFLFEGLPPGRYRLWSGAVPGADDPARALATFDLAPEEALRGLEVRPPR